MIRVVSKSGLSFVFEGSDNSQEEEMEDKIQGYRSKVEECGEYPPWLANVRVSKKDGARQNPRKPAPLT
jgi:hypothetical protein